MKESLIEQISFAVLLIDETSFDVTYTNHAAKLWLGNIIGQSIVSLFPSLSIDILRNRVMRGKTYTQECVIKELDSVRERFVTVTVKKLTDDEFSHQLIVECSDFSKVREQQSILESYANLIQKQSQEIEKAYKKNEELLRNILPQRVMDELMENGTTTPQTFQNVTIMFVDFVNFTKMEVSREPSMLFAELNDIYTHFDDFASKHQCERIKTIGDSYLAVCGLPDSNPLHAENIARLAKEILRYLQERNTQKPIQWHCRIGIHTGSVIGGVVGIKKYIYDVFGDAINTASRMQAYSEPMKINVSTETKNLISNEEFTIISRGKQEVKGKGEMEMFFLEH
ncbi:MAG: adenylate/guanylate cyclase domain-containing protein [Ignavibacteria bacterium]